MILWIITHHPSRHSHFDELHQGVIHIVALQATYISQKALEQGKCFFHKHCIPVLDHHQTCKRSASSEYPYRTSLQTPHIWRHSKWVGLYAFNEVNFSALFTSTSIHESHSRNASCSRRTRFFIIKEINEWNTEYDSSERRASNDLR